jgi:general secretion pathway protein J
MSLVKKKCSAHSAGFTLIELLVALILLGSVFLLLLGSMEFGMKAWSSKEEERHDFSEALAVQNLLRRVLSSARPIMIKVDSSDRRHVFFVGTKTSIRFVAPITSKQLGMGGLFDIAVYLTEAGQSGRRFEISWRHFHPAVSSDAFDEKPVDLMQGVSKVELNYFGRLERGQPARWYSDWQDRQYLPDLIRVRVTRGDQTWPELVVATKVRSAILTGHDTNPEDQASNLP